MLSLDELRSAGFNRSGTWTFENKEFDVSGDFPQNPGVYLFVVGRKVRYVGKADGSLHKRINRYRLTMRKGDRPRSVHEGIEAALDSGKPVHIYTFPVASREPHYRRGLPYDLLTGLEAGLIETLDPKWNPFNSKGRERRRILSTLPSTKE